MKIERPPSVCVVEGRKSISCGLAGSPVEAVLTLTVEGAALSISLPPAALKELAEGLVAQVRYIDHPLRAEAEVAGSGQG